MKKYYYVKCMLDFIFALLALILLSPFLLIIAIIIRLQSKGPVFFLQERLGQNGKVFVMFKFRTMIDGAINMGSGLIADEGDPRITKVGKVLRETSLDELPQLLNILKGEMSFIGPRPPVPYHPRRYDEYSSEQKNRFLVKPGISGFSQVILRNNGTWDERIVYDIKYVKKMSLGFDLYIIFKTFYCIFKKEHIYFTRKNDNTGSRDI